MVVALAALIVVAFYRLGCDAAAALLHMERSETAAAVTVTNAAAVTVFETSDDLVSWWPWIGAMDFQRGGFPRLECGVGLGGSNFFWRASEWSMEVIGSDRIVLTRRAQQ